MSIYVDAWPTQLNGPDGVIYNPTPEQCEAAGYVLGVDPNIAVMQAAAAQAEAQRTAKIQAYRDAYANATAQLCALAGIPAVRVLTMEQVQTAVMPLLSGPNAAMVNGLTTLLSNLEFKLCLEDGKDALDRV